MAELKTKATKVSFAAYLKTIKDPSVRGDCMLLAGLMEAVTGEQPVIWGTGLVGFGTYHYVYASGREGDWPLTGFAARKTNLTIYIMPGFAKSAELLKKLGPHKHSVSCLYVKRLSDLHLPTLKKLIVQSVKDLKARTRMNVTT